MEPIQPSQMSQLLKAWSEGDQDVLSPIIELAYPELHKIAQRCLNNERPGHSVQATALVNEAYLKLLEIRRIDWQDRAHFFAVGARIMRRILVDHARAHGYAKRGGEARRMDFTESLMVAPETYPDLERLDDALQTLEKFDARKVAVVEMKYFGGLTVEEIATVLNLSPQSVHRDWSLAKAWLLREMTRGN